MGVFVSSFVLKKLTLLKWIGLAFPICKGGLITGAYSPRMTSRLIGTAHEMPPLWKESCITSIMFSPTRTSARFCSCKKSMHEIRS